jgi:hypothetical protein
MEHQAAYLTRHINQAIKEEQEDGEGETEKRKGCMFQTLSNAVFL